MSNALKFLPVRKGDVLTYAGQVGVIIGAVDFVPATLGLSAGQVTAFKAALTAAQNASDALDAAKLDKQSKTQALTAPGAAMETLLASLRDIANSARVSTVSDEAIATIGVYRRSANPTPQTLQVDPPEFTLDSVKPGLINVRFRQPGSANPRARDPSAIGIQVAIVNGASAPTDGEADGAPNMFVSRTPASLNSTQMPGNVRLYARWISQRGHVGAWSLPLAVAVM